MVDHLNEGAIRSLAAPERGNHVYFFADAVVQGAQVPRGFGVRVTARGARSFIMDYRHKGRQRRYTIGRWPDWSALLAVREARNLRQRIDRGENPLVDRAPSVAAKTVDDVLDEFVSRYVRNSERPLRRGGEYERAFDRLVRPTIGKVAIYDLRRSHVAKMVDKIEDMSGPVMADRTRSYFRKALAWYAERDDLFNLNAAIVRVAPRASIKERARTRVLSDYELRTIWHALDRAGTFGALLKTLLLTAQRKDEVTRMTRQEIGPDGTWTIPAERYKTKRPNHVPLSKEALAIVAGQPKIGDRDFVFASSAGTPFSAFGKRKVAFDEAVQAARDKNADQPAQPIPNWRLHDLRRTAKTLMQRAGVRPDISERVLGHVIAGVEGTYDRYAYASEKRDALERLAAILERIVNPLSANVALDEDRSSMARGQ
jgi:integrase